WGILTESFIDSIVRSTHAAQALGVSNGANLTLTHTGNLYYTNYLSGAQRGNIQSVTAQLVVPTNYTAAQGVNLYGYVIVNPQGRMTLTHRAADTRFTET